MYEFFSEYLYMRNGFKLTDTLFYLIWIAYLVMLSLRGMHRKKWFSQDFMFIYSILTSIFFIGAFFGGTFKTLTVSTKGSIVIGLGETLGTFIGLVGIPLLLTYIIMFLYKFTKPVLKKLHDKANE